MARIAPETGWLLLVYELPARPSKARVKTWRRLHSLGAVAVKDSVYVLPNTAEAREDFEWLCEEIRSMKGQASVFAVRHLDPGAQDDLIAAFRKARQQEYEAVRREAARLRAARATRKGTAWPARRLAQALRDRLARVAEMDFFSAAGRDEAFAAVDALQPKLEPAAPAPAAKKKIREGRKMATRFRARTWVTRPRPGIDRMASAWLIRRFIDPKAKFRFAEKPAGASAIPFDMYGVEFGHQGTNCTFETLVARFGIGNPAVKRLGQVVHDLDLKEERYAMAEAPAVGRLVEGLRQMYANDRELLERGITMMEALYQSFHSSPWGAGASRKTGRRSR